MNTRYVQRFISENEMFNFQFLRREPIEKPPANIVYI